MNIIRSLFGQKKPTESPWNEDSIYSLIQSRVDPDIAKLDTDDLVLPDDVEVQGDSRVRWAAGAMDGVASYHLGTQKQKTMAKRVASLIGDVAKNGDTRAEASLVEILADESILGIIDDVIELLANRGPPVEPHLHVLALNLCTHTNKRGAVKLGIALLGVMAITKHESIIQTLGMHDEFTLYAAVALSNMFEDPSGPMWELAKSVDGWGRIQVVERLVPTENEEIQRWLRLEGFRNSVMYEYLAHPAAVHGRLCDALADGDVEQEELIAASEIISALIAGDGAPAEGMGTYDKAAKACDGFLRHVAKADPQIQYFLTAHSIIDYVESDEREQSEKIKCGWTEAMRSSVLGSAKAIVANSHWTELCLSALDSDDDMQFHSGNTAARYLDIDTYDRHWKRLVDEPSDNGRWFDVMQLANAERIGEIVELAESEIPLDKIATGPSDELGLGPEYNSHSCLGFVLQDLGPYAGHGWPLIDAGLRSPVIRNRNMAINALEGWGKDGLSSEATSALAKAIEVEPDSDIKERLQNLVKQ